MVLIGGMVLLKEKKRFSLFNVTRWLKQSLPTCCSVVPILYCGIFDTIEIQKCLDNLQLSGSIVSPGYMNPEGIVIYHTAKGYLFKKTIEKDNLPKNLYKNGGVPSIFTKGIDSI